MRVFFSDVTMLKYIAKVSLKHLLHLHCSLQHVQAQMTSLLQVLLLCCDQTEEETNYVFLIVKEKKSKQFFYSNQTIS